MITVQAIDRVLSGLDALLDDHPELEHAVDFYEELLPVLYAARPVLSGLTLQPDQARAKLRSGIPLLWGEWGAVKTDAPALGDEPNLDLLMTLCRLTAANGVPGGDQLMKAVLDRALDLRELLRLVLTQDRVRMTAKAESVALDASLLEAVANLMLSPICWSYQLALHAALDYTDWRQGYCPVCGAWPIIGELRGRDRLRYLRCGRCGAGWSFNRLQCCWCTSMLRTELSFLFDDADPTWRIDICEHCRGYLKTKTTFEPLDAELLVVYDLATIDLDEMAGEAGYRRLLTQPGQHERI